jgi:threonine dehydrogenase-like Zn-dependent dehydrogenase
MKAVVFKEPGKIVIEERPMPQIEKPTDAILKVRMAALCGRYVRTLLDSLRLESLTGS